MSELGQIPEAMMPYEAPPVPTVVQDPDKQAAIRAATYYDRVEAEREQHRQLLEQAKIALEIQITRNGDLQKLLDAERDRYALIERAYHDAIQDRADLEAILADERDHHEDRASRLGRFDFSRLRKRNGKHPKRNGDTVSDNAGSTVEVAIDPHVLASGS